MTPSQLWELDYAPAMRKAVEGYDGPHTVALGVGLNGQAIFKLNLPASQQGHFVLKHCSIEVGGELIPVRVQYGYVPLSVY
jgi:hypothetical protein